jgi:hypothetical protein
MVIVTSDSCNTLVSLDRDTKYNGTSSSNLAGYEEAYNKTEIYLPTDDFSDDYAQPIYFPVAGRVDEYLKHHPEIVEGCDQLLANDPVVLDVSSSDRILYVGQGEVAHALPTQCDVLVTDRATTCHMLALRSESQFHLPLTSLTHIDDTTYDSCIRSMVYEHLTHHQDRFQEEKKEETDLSHDLINLQLHVVGGFEDSEECSSNISSWLLRLLAELADDFKDSIKMTLQTCAISSLNDNGYRCPIARGLAIDLRTGEACLAKVDQAITGPAPQLRAVRVWSGLKSLNVIHTSSSNGLRLEAFSYAPIADIEQLLKLPDHLLLQFTSTSPDVEEWGFCDDVRSTLQFMIDVPCSKVFGPSADHSLFFLRKGASNTCWKRTH